MSLKDIGGAKGNFAKDPVCRMVHRKIKGRGRVDYLVRYSAGKSYGNRYRSIKGI